MPLVGGEEEHYIIPFAVASDIPLLGYAYDYIRAIRSSKQAAFFLSIKWNLINLSSKQCGHCSGPIPGTAVSICRVNDE